MRPGELQPMALVLTQTVPQGNYLFQVKWDGVRIIAFVSSDKVILQNRKLSMRTKQYPELQVLSRLMGCGHTILDGEVVAPRSGGGTSFQAVIRRDFTTSSGSIRSIAEEIPVHYVIFDMLSIDGTSLLHTPLEERLSLMRRNISADDHHVSFIEDFKDGEALHKATRQAGLEGIVAKESGSPYLPGQRVPLWQKIKHRLRGTFPIIGYTTRGERINALVIGTMGENGTLRMAGKVGSGLTDEQILLLTKELPRLTRVWSAPGFPKSATPVYPYLLAEIEFMEWTDDMVVRAPALKGISFGGEGQ